jgi:hypothetical protein
MNRTLLLVLMWLISAATPGIAVRPVISQSSVFVHTGCEADIVESEFRDARVELE